MSYKLSNITEEEIETELMYLLSNFTSPDQKRAEISCRKFFNSRVLSHFNSNNWIQNYCSIQYLRRNNVDRDLIHRLIRAGRLSELKILYQKRPKLFTSSIKYSIALDYKHYDIISWFTSVLKWNPTEEEFEKAKSITQRVRSIASYTYDKVYIIPVISIDNSDHALLQNGDAILINLSTEVINEMINQPLKYNIRRIFLCNDKRRGEIDLYFIIETRLLIENFNCILLYDLLVAIILRNSNFLEKISKNCIKLFTEYMNSEECFKNERKIIHFYEFL